MSIMSDVQQHALMSFAQASALRPERFPVGSGGFVQLIDAMGSDISIVDAARVSYQGQKSESTPMKTLDDARRLVRRLMRDRHSTPFEFCEVVLLVRVPMDAWRQWVRHRTASIAEYSTRYKDAVDDAATTLPGEWRLQSKNNKQGSSGTLEEWPEGWEYQEKNTRRGRIATITAPAGYWEKDATFRPSWNFNITDGRKDVSTPGKFLSYQEDSHLAASRDTYKLRLKLGVAREQARKDLSLSTYTEAYWKCDLHNLLHFLGLRMEKHAQKEIRDFANVIGYKIVSRLFPFAWEAFMDYRLNAVTFSGPECAVLQQARGSAEAIAKLLEAPETEREEFAYKLSRIGFSSVHYDGKVPYSDDV